MHGNPQTCPTNPLDQPEADPLAMPGVTRLLLSVGVSQALQRTGEQCFAIVGKCSFPACPDRWAIYLAPVPMATAAAACDVLLGRATARRIKPACNLDKP